MEQEEGNTQTVEEIFAEVWRKLQSFLQTTVPSLGLSQEKEHLILTGLNKPAQLAWLVSVDKLSMAHRTREEEESIKIRRQAIKDRNAAHFIPILEELLLCTIACDQHIVERAFNFANVIMTLVDELE